MAGNSMMSGLCALVVIAVLVYLADPTFFGLLSLKQGFSSSEGYSDDEEKKEGYANSDDEEKKTDGYNDMNSAVSNGMAGSGMGNAGQADLSNVMGNPNAATTPGKKNPLTQGFADLSSQEGPANFGSTATPAGCYPRDQLTPSELLPKDKNSVWAEQNPMGPGSLKGKNFLSAGALIGVNTVGQSLRNANWQLRSEPPNPQVAVSIFNQSTIAPDTNRRPLEIN
jgi:hypothetical protein